MPPRPYLIVVRELDAHQQAELGPWIIERAPAGIVRLEADDAASLHGLLARLRDLDTELLSVERRDEPT